MCWIDLYVNGIGTTSGTDTIIISSVNKNLAFGTFTAKVKMNDNSIIRITNGTFSNIPIYFSQYP